MKTVVVTGGMSGLGAAIANRLRADNYQVVTWDIDDSADIHCNVADYSSVDRAVRTTRERFGEIDALVNNAGTYISGELASNDPARIASVINVNLLGTINCSRAIVGEMTARRDGIIVNISSDGGLEHRPNRSAYYASKWGVTGFSKCLADDLRKHNVRVTAIFPGLMNTKLFNSANAERDLTGALDPTEVAGLVSYVLATPPNIWLPEVRIRNINQPS